MSQSKDTPRTTPGGARPSRKPYTSPRITEEAPFEALSLACAQKGPDVVGVSCSPPSS